MRTDYDRAMKELRPEYRKWVDEVTRDEDYFKGMDLDDALEEAYIMQQADEHYYEEMYKKLNPEYQEVAYKLIKDGWDEFKAIDEAFEQEYVEYMMREEEKKHQPTREERYPGVVFTPRQKIHTICEDDDLAF